MIALWLCLLLLSMMFLVLLELPPLESLPLLLFWGLLAIFDYDTFAVFRHLDVASGMQMHAPSEWLAVYLFGA